MKVKGIVLYDKQLNGKLNGVFTNNDPNNNAEIFTETARPNLNKKCVNGGTWYEMFYFDSSNGRFNGELNLYKNNHNMFIAEWYVGGSLIFSGFGFDMNERQISLYYESV